jgi:hypothetical protein
LLSFRYCAHICIKTIHSIMEPSALFYTNITALHFLRSVLGRWWSHSRTAAQRILRNSWNSKFHHRVHKCPSQDYVFSQLSARLRLIPLWSLN